MKLDTCIETLFEEVGGTLSGIPPGVFTVAKQLLSPPNRGNTAVDVVNPQNSRSTHGHELPETIEHTRPKRTVGHSPGMLHRSAVAVVSQTVHNRSDRLYTRTQREQLAQAVVQTIDEELTRMEAGHAVEMLYKGTDSDREKLIVQLAEIARNERSKFSARPSHQALGN